MRRRRWCSSESGWGCPRGCRRLGPRAARVIVKVEDSSSGDDTDGGEDHTGSGEEVEDDGNVGGGRARGDADPVTRASTSQFKGVSWEKRRGKWMAKFKRNHLGCHATEEAAARAYNNYVKDGVVPVLRRDPTTTTSHFTGVRWDKSHGKWRATCKKKSLGNHATEEVAAQAYDNYVKDGVGLAPHRHPTFTSQFTGVSWVKRLGKWRAKCNGKWLGMHATEEAAARAYNNYLKDGVVPEMHVEGTSHFKGVCWIKSRGKWQAKCNGKHPGLYTTEEAAARAYDDCVKDGVDPVTRRDPAPSSSRFKVERCRLKPVFASTEYAVVGVSDFLPGCDVL